MTYGFARFAGEARGKIALFWEGSKSGGGGESWVFDEVRMLFTFCGEETWGNRFMIKTEADRILSNALRQTDTERARIAEALIASLDAPIIYKIIL